MTAQQQYILQRMDHVHWTEHAETRDMMVPWPKNQATFCTRFCLCPKPPRH